MLDAISVQKRFQIRMGLPAAIIMNAWPYMQITSRLLLCLNLVGLRMPQWTVIPAGQLKWFTNHTITVLCRSTGLPKATVTLWLKTADYLSGSFKINLDETPKIWNFIKLWKVSFWWLFWRAILKAIFHSCNDAYLKSVNIEEIENMYRVSIEF